MDTWENVQDLFGKKSAGSYEDRPSNKMGSETDLYLIKETYTLNEEGIWIPESVKTQKSGKELFDYVISDFNNSGATEPENAPNWEQIPKVKTRDSLPDNLRKEERQSAKRSGMYVPTNKTHEPYNLQDFPAAPDSLEKRSE